MNMLADYMINKETVLLTGEYDEFGSLCTRVIEGEKTFLVQRTPVQVINKTLLRLGSSFRGARDSSKEVLGVMKMYPLKINQYLGIWLFPTKACSKQNCVWFSLMHIKKTKAIGVRKTEVLLSYNHTFEIEMKETSFNNKRQKAEELREIITKNTKSPLTFYIEPKPGFRISEDAGTNRYRIR
ncbi:competence protein ComK [Bacillus sp. T33-2]|uniref:competence protein ComK n=1 Tax=Bacillus sp. T33-2 TaxID=2054168 RepID=UPI000C794143|nr:competence protein ComK [Bacillus sp. T33-2]PLR95896.1 hypothetical protein CVD19_12785 [Bacillus sp. T33-2]